jgi:glyoxylase-like metal-dependent hydrolase (beta-lactamase superfamily II)
MVKGEHRMKTQEIGTRGVLFTFEEPYKANVFMIKGDNNVFLLDTFLGNDPMKEVKHYVEESRLSSKPLVVFNSHADYDHYWGNGSFKDSLILGHELCLKRIESESEAALKEFEGHKLGEVEIVPPNLVFSERIVFVDDGVEFFYTPGHTIDSASCFDHLDKTLFVGDNLESPIPYVNELNFRTFKATLQGYLNREPKTVICGHCERTQDDNLIRHCIDYVNRLEWHRVEVDKLDRRGKIIHFANLTSVGEKLRERRLLKEALAYYTESMSVLERMPDDVKGKDHQRKIVMEIMDILSTQQ